MGGDPGVNEMAYLTGVARLLALRHSHRGLHDAHIQRLVGLRLLTDHPAVANPGKIRRLPLDAPYIYRGVQVHYCPPPWHNY